MKPSLPLGPVDKSIRLGCGGLVGLLLAVGVGWYWLDLAGLASSGPTLVLAVVLVVACAFLALRHGDRFWARLSEFLRPWWTW